MLVETSSADPLSRPVVNNENIDEVVTNRQF